MNYSRVNAEDDIGCGNIINLSTRLWDKVAILTLKSNDKLRLLPNNDIDVKANYCINLPL